MTEQLKPCPFCGGINVIHSDYRMYCHACGAEGPDADSADESAAIAAWNRRAQPAQDGAEPVAWQRRMRPTWGNGDTPWGPWEECSESQAKDYWKTPLLHDWAYEARALYTHPPAARVPLTTDEIAKCWGQVEGTRHGYAPFAHAIIAAYEAKNDIGGKS